MARKNIYDIAQKADVSIATVSRVMNNSPEISDATREKVLKIVDDMGYYPQAYAQGLARKKKNQIIVLVPVISNYFFMEVLGGVQDELADKDYDLNIFNISGNGESIFNQVETVIKRQAGDGYILISTHLDDKQHRTLMKYDASISLVDENFSQLDSVCVCNEDGTAKAMNYFVEQGYRRIALISASDSSKPSILRIEGYKAALQQAGIQIDESLIVSGESMYRDGFTEENGYRAMKKLLAMKNPPEACFCTSDIQAIGALKALREGSKRIPIIGYDDITISNYVGLSTVRQPMYKMGSQATIRLLKRMEDPDLEPHQTTFEPELVLRSSTELN